MTIRTLLGFAFLSLAAVSVVLAGPRSARADSVPPSSKPLARRVLSPPTKVPPAPAKLYSLADVAAGERLVVVVMKGSWCQVCVRQLAELAKRKPALDKLGVRVVGLNTDPPGHNADVMRRHKLPFPILSDPRHVVIGALGAWRADWGHALPSIVVFVRIDNKAQDSKRF